MMKVWVVTHPPIDGGQPVPPEVFENEDDATEWARLGNLQTEHEWSVFGVWFKDREAAQITIDYNRRVVESDGLV